MIQDKIDENFLMVMQKIRRGVVRLYVWVVIKLKINNKQARASSSLLSNNLCFYDR